MKIAQFVFRFLCLALAVFQFGIFVNEAFLEVDSFETNDIEVSDSDFGESDSENPEEEVPVLSFFSNNLFISQDLNFALLLKRNKIHFQSRKLVSQTQSVPFSPPEFLIF
jgi:hypothetical protein